MNLQNKKIGVWGFGISGKATVNFLEKQHANIQVLDKKKLTEQEHITLATKNISFLSPDKLDQFLQSNELIIASPGIDLSSYQSIKHKLIAELDLFAKYFKKSIIAITGTLGKTTITTLLSQILQQQHFSIATGGNIGVGMCDLLNDNTVDYGILEVSSFQLEHCKTFAPDLAIITNFYPNHLDRHKTLNDYWQAKLNIIRHQKKHQQALIPLHLIDQLPKDIVSTVTFFSLNKPTQKQKMKWANHALLWINNQQIIKSFKNLDTPIYSFNKSSTLFTENILCVAAALSLLNKPIDNLSIEPIEHRMENVATINDVSFYNDSKATVPEATLAAVNQFNGKSIHLFLGGLNKGVDRQPLIAALKDKVKFIYCFGFEADQLYQLCNLHSVQAAKFKTLQETFAACIKNTNAGDIVLFSPSGASFDLFDNYQKRGKYFKELVLQLKQT